MGKTSDYFCLNGIFKAGVMSQLAAIYPLINLVTRTAFRNLVRTLWLPNDRLDSVQNLSHNRFLFVSFVLK